MKHIQTLVAATALAAWLPLPAQVSAAESLSYPKLAQFQLANTQNLEGQTFREWIPKGETLQSWRRMITIHRFSAMPQKSPRKAAEFQSALSAGWQQSCPNSGVAPIRNGVENGHQYIFWLLSCRENPQTGKPEITWVKAIDGNDALYVVQYAFRYAPSEDEVRAMARWMREVKVVPPKAR